MQNPRPLLLRLSAIGAAALLALVSLPPPAVSAAPAAPADSATHGRVAYAVGLNTATWRVCVSGWTEGQNASHTAISRVSATDVNASSVNCPGSWNLSSYSASYPDGWYGATSCSLPSGSRCASTSIRLNGRTITTSTQWTKTATHEFGHAAGLGHRATNSSCMTQGAAPPIGTTFDTHDRDSINANY
jgi:hypothetical protein